MSKRRMVRRSCEFACIVQQYDGQQAYTKYPLCRLRGRVSPQCIKSTAVCDSKVRSEQSRLILSGFWGRRRSQGEQIGVGLLKLSNITAIVTGPVARTSCPKSGLGPRGDIKPADVA